MAIKLYISYAADLAAVILMFWQFFRLDRLPAERTPLKRYFRFFCWIVLLMSMLHLLTSYANLELGGLTPDDYGSLGMREDGIWLWIVIASIFIDIFLSTVFIYMWVRFMCWSLFEDRDYIRRKFWVGFSPLLLGAVLTGVTVPMAVMSEFGYYCYLSAITLFFLIRLFYLLIGLWLLREYKRQNGYLRFFNPWVFFIPVFAGWLAQDLFEWGFSALGSTVGLMMIFASIVEEQRYMAPETGLYNMDFAGYLKTLIRKERYMPLSAMRFTLNDPDEMKSFSEALKKQLPKDCEPIVHTDREIVVLTSVRERGPLAMVIGDVQASCKVDADIILKKKSESAEEFMDRVL